MSSSKDYSLEIVTNSNQSSVNFVVRNKPSFFIRYVRLPLACILLSWVIPQGVNVSKSYFEAGGLSRSELYDRLCQLLQSDAQDIVKHNASLIALLTGILGVALLLSLEQASDTLMVMQDMGIQISSKSKWKFLNIGRNGNFIPISEIIDIVIHEGFHGYGQVIYYMCVLTRDKERGGSEGNGVSVIFPNFLPRKDILLQVWKSSRQMLYGTTRRHYRHVPGQGLREVQHLH
ncbi:hypothetical protein JCM33374_g6198 [Metschnikowia sp. JCM 33374]|nr:hypothetical protein JCM33374_g6198 [Metschnikowia sp. JCM 33374]